MGLLYAHFGNQSSDFDDLSEHRRHAQILEGIFVFYDVFVSLCSQKGVSPNKALVDCNIGRTASAKWKKGSVPRGVTLQKLADYFGVSTDYLLGNENTPTGTSRRELTDEDIYGAFFKGSYSEKKLNKLKKMAKLIDDEDNEG